MDLDPSQQSPEQEKSREADNARKFITEPLDPEFLDAHNATSFLLITDWTETGEDNETKLVYKKLDDGDTKIFLISKVTKDGKRTKEKEEITEDKYKELLAISVSHVEKKRHEFTFEQNGTFFTVNYDEFDGSKLFMLDVDAKSKNNVERELFDSTEFPSKDSPIGLVEVSDDPQYSGHRIADIVR